MRAYSKRLSTATILMALVLASVSGCQAEPRVVLVTRDGKEVPFRVEIADTPDKREIGLMYRKDLAADRGMIFIFGRESPQSFWMKNTPIALDMLFISADKKIVGIVEEATPFTLEPRGVAAPSQFVLEINGGLSKRHQIRVGDGVRFESVPVQVRE